eukprot:g5809.t1
MTDKECLLIIRADASNDVGLGHLLRSLCIANAWDTMGGSVHLISHCPIKKLATCVRSHWRAAWLKTTHPHPDDFSITLETIEKRIKTLNEKSNIYIMFDGYNFDSKYESELVHSVRKRNRTYRIFSATLDDVASKTSFSTNFILNANAYAQDMLQDYASRCTNSQIFLYTFPQGNMKRQVSFDGKNTTTLLFGSSFTPIRKEFLRHRHSTRLDEVEWYSENGLKYHSTMEILISMGGSDPSNSSLLVLKSVIVVLRSLQVDALVTVVVGPAYIHRASLEEVLCNVSDIKVDIVTCFASHKDGDEEEGKRVESVTMATLMARACLAITTPSTTSWELLFMGVPTLTIIVAENQVKVAEYQNSKNVAFCIGRASVLSVHDVTSAVQQYVNDSSLAWSMARRGRALIDGFGAYRVALSLCPNFQPILKIRSAKSETTKTSHLGTESVSSDAWFLWRLSNERLVRLQSLRQENIPWKRHLEWFQMQLARSKAKTKTSVLLIIEMKVSRNFFLRIGTIRFETKTFVANNIKYKHAWCVSLSLIPSVRGRGLGAAAITSALPLLSFLGQVRVHAITVSISNAEVVLVHPHKNGGKAKFCHLERKGETISFIFQKTRYIYNDGAFQVLGFPESLPLEEYGSRKSSDFNVKWLNTSEERWGLNELDIPLPQFAELFQEHATQPFFVFQVFCVALWMLDDVWMMALFTLLMLVVFECVLVKQRIASLEMLRQMRRSPKPIMAFRNGAWKVISSKEIVPSDVISIRKSRSHIGNTDEDSVCPCDVLLLRGSCIVNEALLTGESVPLQKESCAILQREYGADTLLDLELPAHCKAVVFGGTKILQHNVVEEKTTKPIWKGKMPRDGGCPAYVLRTGWYTTQGGLMRTILFSSSRVTANSAEAFKFIGILLQFAIVAALYVLHVSWNDTRRDRWKLFLHCTIILTAVIPPELPMELSLAVTTALGRLRKYQIVCTEPFRIPFAGKIDVCCFDKTGTLTSDVMEVCGVASTVTNGNLLENLTELKDEAKFIIATCHSLVNINGKLEGDEMEKASLLAIDWSFNGQIAFDPNRKLNTKLHVLRRFPFSSSLKRMSAVIEFRTKERWIVCKGAPEALLPLMDDKSLTPHYRRWYRRYALRGKRVLALAYRPILSSENDISSMNRIDAENGLRFVGFLVFRCPNKPDSKKVIRRLKKSKHRVLMITGDSALTACNVAAELSLIKKTNSRTLILRKTLNDNNNICAEASSSLEWLEIGEEDDEEEDLIRSFHLSEVASLHQEYDLCVTGEALSILHKESNCETKSKMIPSKALVELSSHTTVWARVAPKQKELIIAALKACGNVTLMCGDGTNDVGALKLADVGIAVLNSADMSTNVRKKEDPFSGGEEIVQFGDASIAAPFTSKFSSIRCTELLVRFGRSTLVTTLQMYKIIALNCLVSAFMLSVLYANGIKQGDQQDTIFGMLIAAFFLLISKAEPLARLAPKRPPTSIFNAADILSIIGQITVHIGLQVYVLQITRPFVNMDSEEMQPDSDFQPNVINTVVFLLATLQSVNNFVINYQGHPFMTGITENKYLMWCVVIAYFCIFITALDWFEPLSDLLECVALPVGFCSDGMTFSSEIACVSQGICSTSNGQFSQEECESPEKANSTTTNTLPEEKLSGENGNQTTSILPGEWTANEFTPLEWNFNHHMVSIMLVDSALSYFWNYLTRRFF